MTYSTLILVLLFTCYHVNAEVIMIEGVKEKVTFTGNVLTIRVDNRHNKRGAYSTCFESDSAPPSKECPSGFAILMFTISTRVRTYQVNRAGHLLGESYDVVGKIRFDKDDSINVLLPKIPFSHIVTLVNAYKVIPVTSTTSSSTYSTSTEKMEETKSNKVLITVVAGLVALAIIIVSALVLWYCFCRKISGTQIESYTVTGSKINAQKPQNN
uniref:Uncharacterized protein n=1 Tax=Panagrellus redivivus TaxID=6233 RepID=A0A7E4UYS1_PANRE